MKTQFTVSVTGPDHAGLLKQLADMTHQHGGIWKKSKVVRLNGLFAGLFSIEIEPAAVRELETAFHNVPDYQIQLAPPGQELPLPEETLLLSVTGEDRPGLVNDISQVLLDHQIEIEGMACERLVAGGYGNMLFRADFTLHLPADIDQDVLSSELEQVEQNIIVHLDPLEEPA